jgi:saccharopepsin
MVDLEALIRFVFPSELQHAMSTGRLLAFGFYGPLDADARLRSGHKGSHVVGRWELDTMCRTFEREDILQVYMPAGKSPSSLSEQEAEELLAQADTRLKVAKGKAMMRQVTPDEVRSLFEDLERDPGDGLMNFHDMQKRISKLFCFSSFFFS